MRPIQLVLPLILSGCVQPAASVSGRPMDEVPVQQLLATGDREYRFSNGCVVVMQAVRAIVLTESKVCKLFQRDIALLYASAD